MTNPVFAARYVGTNGEQIYPVRVSFARVARAPKPANCQFAGRALAYAAIHPKVLRTDALDTVRVLAWADPQNPGKHVVGFLHETWTPRGLSGTTPKTMTLYEHQRFSDPAAALNACDALALNNTYSQIHALFGQAVRVTSDPGDLPFLRPLHWCSVHDVRAGRPFALKG
ncbi:MAG: hypothetical protein H6865_07270 [Rhodospirillales bacterium]|nr:hypothetical protein [Alphaproteobacteria bacterium]MCB9987417.1 hypothetical protein [Rhodospirillales bacterium]USO07601.1 MAG: hypothetical protein H6866_09385 [Rhodospirillales bacterium]